jgi:hypothetical protein
VADPPIVFRLTHVGAGLVHGKRVEDRVVVGREPLVVTPAAGKGQSPLDADEDGGAGGDPVWPAECGLGGLIAPR